MNKSGVLWPLYSSSLTWHRRGTIVNERTKMMVASLGVCFILEVVLIVQRRTCLCKSVSVALWVNQRYCSSKLASSPSMLHSQTLCDFLDFYPPRSEFLSNGLSDLLMKIWVVTWPRNSHPHAVIRLLSHAYLAFVIVRGFYLHACGGEGRCVNVVCLFWSHISRLIVNLGAKRRCAGLCYRKAGVCLCPPPSPRFSPAVVQHSEHGPDLEPQRGPGLHEHRLLVRSPIPVSIPEPSPRSAKWTLSSE